ncbi:MAG: prepilin-type N-terminal cleavage/methylation domain-containing protein, partial [Verrucomicrobia bacterium]|nr:prepilin-type N-terminal cleavage/methylation domain-containing protein [Verrucomicrobiota bacterium]
MSTDLKTQRPRRVPQTANGGFTLVELMVSITVLALLGGLVMQLMGSASKLTSTSKLASDCDTEARYALNQIAADINHRVRRPDVDAFIDKLDGDDRLYLFAETPGYSETLDATQRSDVSLVGYRLNSSVNALGKKVYKLERYCRALPWSLSGAEIPMPYVVLDASTGLPTPESTLAGTGGGAGGSFKSVITQDPTEDVYYQPIAENVVRFEVSVLRKPDLTTTPPTDARLLTNAEIPTELSRSGLGNISAIIVTIAV